VFNSQTVFVLGAGASYEAGLPIGAGLVDLISSKLDIEFDDLGIKNRSGDLALFRSLISAYSNPPERSYATPKESYS
jgi:hypothetical protein